MNCSRCLLFLGLLTLSFHLSVPSALAQDDAKTETKPVAKVEKADPQGQSLTFDELKTKMRFDLSPLKPQKEFVSSYADVVDQAAPPVVTIYSDREEDPELEEMMQDPFFRRLFPMPELPREDRITGSGVIVSADGYILTNNHVVEQSKGIEVLVNSINTTFEATVIVSDPKTDVALIKVEGAGLPMAVIGDSQRLRVGDVTLAIGNPFGLSQTVTQGIVSALGRGTSQLPNLVDYASFIQTDASINRGNSGGALVDAEGRLIGINTAIQVGGGGGNIGIGFAIPVDMALSIVDRLLDGGGVVKRGFLGVYLQEIDRELSDKLGWGKNYGVAVGRVMPETPAEEAGLLKDDVIMAFNGMEARDVDSLRLSISDTPPNKEVTFKIFRDKKEISVPVTLAELPEDPTAMMGAPQLPQLRGDAFLDGVEIVELTDEVRKNLKLDKEAIGVAVESVDPKSSAHDSGLRAGQLIVEVNQQTVNTVAEAEEALAITVGPIALVRVLTDGKPSTLAIPLR